MKLREMFRSATFDPTTLDEENRTVDLAFSSENTVDQYFGREILSHAPGAADLSRLNDGAPLLINHNRSQHIGVVEDGSARIDQADKKGRAKVRFSRSAAGESAMQDVKDKVLRHVSVGYRIKDMKQSGGTRSNPEYTVTKWQPTEISLCPIPADHSVGVGRSDAVEEREVNVTREAATPKKGNIMDPEELARREAALAAREAEIQAKEASRAEADTRAAGEAARAQILQSERTRVTEITAMGAKIGKADLARQLIESGKSIDEARSAFFEALGFQERSQSSIADAPNVLDLTDKEKGQYSLIRALRAQIDGNWKEAGFERECSIAIAQRAGKSSTGFFMPVNLPVDTKLAEAARATSATAYGVTVGQTGGSNLVATNLLTGSFIELLRNKARVISLGARMLSGLVGNVVIPRQNGATQTYWISPEGSDIPESEGSFDSIGLTPKTIGAYSQITRQMLMQSSPDIEMLVRDDLATVMALGIDLAALIGTGQNGQPTGILNIAGIGAVAIGPNGGPVSIDNLIDLETAVLAANVDETSLAYLTNAQQVGKLKKLKDGQGRYLWEQYPGAQRTAGIPGELNGYSVARSNQVPATLTKGGGTNLSAHIFGNWSDLIIGEWGVLEILPNQFGAGYKSGSIELRALQTIDLNVRHKQAFAAITDAA